MSWRVEGGCFFVRSSVLESVGLRICVVFLLGVGTFCGRFVSFLSADIFYKFKRVLFVEGRGGVRYGFG